MSINQPLDKVYDPRAVEPEMFELWESSGAFRSKPANTPHEKTFCIVIPPPNVTGALHLGHALNNTLQDILVRYHRMRGFNTLWQPGTDHAGIATQAVVEKRIRETEGKTRYELGPTLPEAREELVNRIWKWKDEYEARIVSQLKLMGCSCDWERLRFTLDDGLSKAVRLQFFNLFKDGLIFRGKRLVNWDTQLQTAVSDDEVYHEAVKGHFWHIKYPVIDPKRGEPEFVIIATTRPETMLGDVAVAVHPDPEGELQKRETEARATIEKSTGKDRMEAEAELTKIAERRETHLPLLVKLRDMAKDGRKLRLPLAERVIPLITDEWANPMLGSGCVKITPAHDANDYEVGVRHSLAMLNVLTPDGKVAPVMDPDGSKNPNTGPYEGLTFNKEGREKVVADLEARGLIHAIEDREIELAHSDRSKVPIEPYLSDQWFLKMGDISEPGASAPDCSRSQNTPPSSASTTTVQRTSAANRPVPDLSAKAVLLTWTTYGTWLPGDERGFVSYRYQQDGEYTIHNIPGEPYDADDSKLHANAERKMQGEPVNLAESQADLLVDVFLDVCNRHSIIPLAIAVMRNHVHIVCQSDQDGARLLQLFKGNAASTLSKRFKLEKSPRWWTSGGSARWTKNRGDCGGAIEYVRNQEYPLRVWLLDELQSGGTTQVRQSGAEAPGSLGVRLGDGSTAPGLAQAAMDVVTNGRISMYPSRYSKTYLDWLGEKRDWCISRQLWWGHRIPVWERELAIDDDLRSKLDRWESEGRACANNPTGAAEKLSDSEVADPEYWFWYVAVNNSHDGDVLSELQHYDFIQDPDVLDTWFSSALWPFSTLGWPEKTEYLNQYYPGSVLVTSRDIITLWVVRMVMFGLYATGKVPFDRVFITPKVLDGRGETMSKSKGNGVDPVDIIHIYGADALRFGMADMTTETQDIRMPVEYLCPHCGGMTDQGSALKTEEQARKSRGQKLDRKLNPADCLRVRCANKECGREFATQWADKSLQEELGRGREVSDRFEVGRNFCNKLWNAARFAFMNLEGVKCERIDMKQLPPEDRWILARLSQTVRRMHELMDAYQYSAIVKELRDFFWDSLCDWYIELTKPRMNSLSLLGRGQGEGLPSVAESDSTNAQSTAWAKQVLAFCIDQVLRLWHPIIPFITERLWQQLNTIAPQRGLPPAVELCVSGKSPSPQPSPQGGEGDSCVPPNKYKALVLAQFPPVEGYSAFDDAEILTLFSKIQDVVRGVRELRDRCNVSPKQDVVVTVALPEPDRAQFTAHAHIVKAMAGVEQLTIDPTAKRPKNAGAVTIGSLRVFVHDIIDDASEHKRTTTALEDIEKQIAGKESKLSNEKFVANAKPDIVAAERERLNEMLKQRSALREHLSQLSS